MFLVQSSSEDMSLTPHCLLDVTIDSLMFLINTWRWSSGALTDESTTPVKLMGCHWTDHQGPKIFRASRISIEWEAQTLRSCMHRRPLLKEMFCVLETMCSWHSSLRFWFGIEREWHRKTHSSCFLGEILLLRDAAFLNSSEVGIGLLLGRRALHPGRATVHDSSASSDLRLRKNRRSPPELNAEAAERRSPRNGSRIRVEIRWSKVETLWVGRNWFGVGLPTGVRYVPPRDWPVPAFYPNLFNFFIQTFRLFNK